MVHRQWRRILAVKVSSGPASSVIATHRASQPSSSNGPVSESRAGMLPAIHIFFTPAGACACPTQGTLYVGIHQWQRAWLSDQAGIGGETGHLVGTSRPKPDR